MSFLKKFLRWFSDIFFKTESRNKRKGLVCKKPQRSVVRRSLSEIQSKRYENKGVNKKNTKNKKKIKPSNSKKLKRASVGGSNNTKNLKEVKKKDVPLGEITHYFNKIKVCVVRLDSGPLKRGDQIMIKGKESSFSQKVDSMQIENEDVNIARKGQLVGLKVKNTVSVGSKVSLVSKK